MINDGVGKAMNSFAVTVRGGVLSQSQAQKLHKDLLDSSTNQGWAMAIRWQRAMTHACAAARDTSVALSITDPVCSREWSGVDANPVKRAWYGLLDFAGLGGGGSVTRASLVPVADNMTAPERQLPLIEQLGKPDVVAGVGGGDADSTRIAYINRLTVSALRNWSARPGQYLDPMVEISEAKESIMDAGLLKGLYGGHHDRARRPGQWSLRVGFACRPRPNGDGIQHHRANQHVERNVAQRPEDGLAAICCQRSLNHGRRLGLRHENLCAGAAHRPGKVGHRSADQG